MRNVTPRIHPARKPRDTELLEFIQRVSPDADPASILLFRRVHGAHHLLMRAVEKQLEIAGLSVPKFMMLIELERNEVYGTGGGLLPSELSERQGIPRNSVSTLLAGLEEEGLVSRELHGTDRRKFVIRLTPQGHKTLNSRLGTQFRQITQCFAGFSAEERATLLELLTRLTQSLIETNP